MNTMHMKYIVEVGKMKSITKAAENLYVTQSAVSQAINSIEKELGVQLFYRSKSGTLTTTQGKNIIIKFLEILEKVKEIEMEVSLYTEEEGKEIRVAAIPGLFSSLVKTITKFKSSFPRIDVTLKEKTTKEIIEAIKENQLDAGLIIMSNYYLHEVAGLDFETLTKGELVAIVGKQSAFFHKKYLTPEDLLNQPLILNNDEYTQWFESDFQARYGKLDLLFKTDNVNAIRYALINNLGITVEHQFNQEAEPLEMNQRIRKIKIKNYKHHPLTLGWLYSSHTKNSIYTKRFIDYYKIENG